MGIAIIISDTHDGILATFPSGENLDEGNL